MAGEADVTRFDEDSFDFGVATGSFWSCVVGAGIVAYDPKRAWMALLVMGAFLTLSNLARPLWRRRRLTKRGGA